MRKGITFVKRSVSLIFLVAGWLLVWGQERPEGFASLTLAMSEQGGRFDSDNLISNEAAYLDVMQGLEKVRGGVYIGVGPDQNFSYLAQIRPEIAFLVDIRRDNMLEHLMFRALFEQSRNRMEFLCLLLGRPVPENVGEWSDKPIGTIVDYLDRRAVSGEKFAEFTASTRARVGEYGVPLEDDDVKKIKGILSAFRGEGLKLRFQSYNRAPQSYYPNLRELLEARDRSGKQSSYLGQEERFQYVKKMHEENRIVPVVGDFAGDKALRKIGEYAKERKLEISAVYASNLEQYVIRRGDAYQTVVRNLRSLPLNSRSVIIRSAFGPYARGARNGSYSVQLMQPLQVFLAAWDAGKIRDWGDIVNRPLQ